MGAQAIDLSAGLLPKSNIDLSAGLVPTPPAPDKSWLQRQKDEFDQSTAPDASDSLGRFALKRVIAGVLSPVVHPVDTAVGTYKMVQQGMDAINPEQHQEEMRHGPVSQIIDRTEGDYKQGGLVRAGTGIAADMAGMALAGKVAELAPKIVRAAPETAAAVADIPQGVKRSASKLVAGSKLDQPIPGDTVTPRELYQTAKNMGVNLDTAQATGSAVTQMAKKMTEHDPAGSAAFEANKTANTNALYVQAEKVLNDAHPEPASREQFGNEVRTRLLEDQEAQNSGAGALFDELTHDIGNKQPNVADVKTQAAKIVSENAGYYSKHPEMLTGGTGKAWNIINSLAKTGEVADTWSDLHKLRSDLMDITRGPELVGDRPIGWMKQMTSAVDKSMTEAGSGLNGAALEKFRNANQIYARMKQTYDNPNSALYRVIRATDGLKAADQLLSARMSPAVARQIAGAAPELMPQLQRQTMSKLLSPTGNEVPDLQNLPARFGRAQKEALRGVLTPEQIQSMEDMARVTKAVNFDTNPSGSGKLLQGVQAMRDVRTTAGAATAAAATGNPALAAGLVGMKVGDVLATRAAAKALTNPAFTDWALTAPSRSKAWVESGAAKMSQSGVSGDTITALTQTPRGRSILMRASGLSVNSAALASLARQAHQNQEPSQK